MSHILIDIDKIESKKCRIICRAITDPNITVDLKSYVLRKRGLNVETCTFAHFEMNVPGHYCDESPMIRGFCALYY